MKALFLRECEDNDNRRYSDRILKSTFISPDCPRDFYRAQNDKYSDLRNGVSVTVMAVAAELHCDFLIPEHIA